MKERGMIFNSLMVNALLDGRKKQTRRVMKVQPDNPNYGLSLITSSSDKSMIGKYHWSSSDATGANDKKSKLFSCPFGAVGDRIWVRETYMLDAPRDGSWPDVEFYGCKGASIDLVPERFKKPEFCIFRTSWSGSKLVGWKPAIHMPRWASRILLEITEIKVERLQSISDRDAEQEGLFQLPFSERFTIFDGAQHIYGADRSAKKVFSWLWVDIYGEDDWDANPYVWVIKFKRVEV